MRVSLFYKPYAIHDLFIFHVIIYYTNHSLTHSPPPTPHPTPLTHRGDIRFRTQDRFQLVEAIYDFDKATALMRDKLAKLVDRDRG